MKKTRDPLAAFVVDSIQVELQIQLQIAKGVLPKSAFLKII